MRRHLAFLWAAWKLGAAVLSFPLIAVCDILVKGNVVAEILSTGAVVAACVAWVPVVSYYFDAARKADRP